MTEFYEFDGVIFAVNFGSALCRASVGQKFLSDGKIFNQKANFHGYSRPNSNFDVDFSKKIRFVNEKSPPMRCRRVFFAFRSRNF